ncbi:MAG: hypothetical protein ABI200_05950 [Gaiellales bacterium]
MTERRGTFVEHVLDGLARADQLEAEVVAWAGGTRRRELHEVLGLDADELELVASVPDALRYILHARRFGEQLELDDLRGQARIRAHATQIASAVVDPFDLADIESWTAQLDALLAADREPSHV